MPMAGWDLATACQLIPWLAEQGVVTGGASRLPALADPGRGHAASPPLKHPLP